MQKLRKISGWLLAAALLSPGFAHAAVQPLPFTDIKKHWAKQSIIRAVGQGLFAAGGKVTQFYPEREMTRAEFLALLDRLLYHGQEQLFGLTLLSDEDQFSRTEGFDEPYLPYSDVDRLTWMYNPMVRVSVMLDRLYGPGSLQTIFPGKDFHPGQPITRREAARLLQMFTASASDQKALEEIMAMKWLEGEQTGSLKRGEAAVMADKVIQYFDARQILPLLDYDGFRFPLVPNIKDVFPLFTGYYNLNLSEDEKTYIDCVKAISNQEDGEETYAKLQKLADTQFPNQIGVHYYLSWDTSKKLENNLREAFLAIDAYFADKVIKPETMELLAANVYDIYMQMEQEKDPLAASVLQRLSSYEARTKEGAEEWQALSTYLAALEVKNGMMEQALDRYQKFPQKDVALLNSIHYLLETGKADQAEKLLQELQQKKQTDERKQLLMILGQELETAKKQQEIISDLSFTMRRMENLSGYKVDGESMQSGISFKYSQLIDSKGKASHTTGFYQSPDKLVTDKLEMYDDDKNKLQYFYDYDEKKWIKSSIGSDDYIHNWVESKTIAERASQLHAYYMKQSFGTYDVITEWIPGDHLTKKSSELSLEKGKLKRVPAYVNKYYIDRDTDLLVQQVWRYEEVYESNRYVINSGKETYSQPSHVRVIIPQDVIEGAGGR